jgi:steroid delta-isomerase-like uncharacterized protein
MHDTESAQSEPAAKESAAKESAAKESAANESAQKQFLRRAMDEIFTAGRSETIETFYSADLCQNIRSLVNVIRTGFPDLEMKIEHMVEEGEYVACRWKAAGTHRGWFHGIPPTRARVSWSGTGMYAFADGKIAGVKSTWDLYGLLQQLRDAMR